MACLAGSCAVLMRRDKMRLDERACGDVASKHWLACQHIFERVHFCQRSLGKQTPEHSAPMVSLPTLVPLRVAAVATVVLLWLELASAEMKPDLQAFSGLQYHLKVPQLWNPPDIRNSF